MRASELGVAGERGYPLAQKQVHFIVYEYIRMVVENDYKLY